MTALCLSVAGSHTEIGKTWVACALLRAARAAGWSVDVLKPVVSGFDPRDWAGSDPGRLLAAAGRPLTDAALDAISPWRLRAPLAPPEAARLEGRRLPFAEVRRFVQRRLSTTEAEVAVVEGVGGLMSPIAEGATSLDLLGATRGPCVLVAGSYLGAISHALTALEVMRARGRAPAGLVVSEAGRDDDPDFEGTLGLLREHLGETPLVAARHGDERWAAGLFAQLRIEGAGEGR